MDSVRARKNRRSKPQPGTESYTPRQLQLLRMSNYLIPNGNPRVLDASQTNARGRKDGWVGIYSLEGDTLKWCVSKKTRPATFETVKGQFLLILKRVKAQE